MGAINGNSPSVIEGRKSSMYADHMLTKYLQDHKPRAAAMKNQPAFYRNLEQAIDISRADPGFHAFHVAKPRWDDSVLDFTSSDFLSFSRSGRIREAFSEELSRHESFRLSASGSRVQYGNYDYLIQIEQELADFHGAEAAYIAHSGFMANAGTVAAVPLPGDAIVYDESVHASTHEGMKLSLASHQVSFQHNDADSLREVLSSLKETNKAFSSGNSSILIAVESVYSTDGDVCPLNELVQVAKEIFPLGNAQFIIDEAHSNGVMGPKGAGLVDMLGLEKEIAIRIHMCSKALGSTGGKLILLNYRQEA
jgi:8-amino-7-oxononanoate synthase